MAVAICPIHEYARHHCTYRCRATRKAFARAASALRVYWWQRKRGIRAMTTAEYRIRYGWPPRA